MANQNITNKELWNIYTSGSPSPQNYLDWSWTFTIAAALQRRVWIGPPHQPCFPSMNVILVGPPAVGKGTAIRPAQDILSYWNKEQFKPVTDKLTAEDKVAVEVLLEADLRDATDNEVQGKNRKADIFKPKLFPDAGDATTYEALVESVGQSYRRINYVAYCPKRQRDAYMVYGHSSMYFALPELSSLLRKKVEDTVNYLLGVYDCPEEYRYTTKHQGRDRVKRACISIIAGATPNFIQDTFTSKLVDEGFSSRTFFAYAAKPKRIQAFFPPFTAEQELAKQVLLQHVFKLAGLYGQVKIEQDTIDFIQNILAKELSNRDNRANKNQSMDSYYGRKNQHLIKVAMAFHFGESIEMVIPLETFKKAADFLAQEEKFMHMATNSMAENIGAKVAGKIIELLAPGEANWVDIYVKCHKVADKKTIEDAIAYLMETNQVIWYDKEDEITKKITRYWKIAEMGSK